MEEVGELAHVVKLNTEQPGLTEEDFGLRV